MTKIIIANAPADAGKDEAIAYLKFTYGVHPFSFKTELKSLTLKLYCISEALWDSWYTRLGKELPREELGGLSCRQALIRVSEEIVKPNFGKDYFGRAEAVKLKAISEQGSIVAACSDGGFNEEINPMIATFGAENIYVLKIHRPYRSFKGDSRNWIDHPEIPSYNYYNVQNDKDLSSFWDELDRFYNYTMTNTFNK